MEFSNFGPRLVMNRGVQILRVIMEVMTSKSVPHSINMKCRQKLSVV